MNTLGEWSWVAATGNVSSMLLVGPMLVVVMRRLGWSRLRMLLVALVGWCALFVAQVVMWRVFGYQAGYPGFRHLQWMALPISAGNFAASLWLMWQPQRDREKEPA